MPGARQCALAWVVPATLAIIFVLLYLTFGRLGEALLIMATLPFALTGGVWLLYMMGYNLSVATGVGHRLGWGRQSLESSC
jgi:Cu(I)/Ag(I) efflux system membrane protein CusA/SilA